MLDKVILILTKANTISKKISAKASAAKPLVKPLPGGKTLGLDPETWFYDIEDGDDTKEGEEAEIIFIYDSGLAVYKQNTAKRKFPYIDTFNHKGPSVISTMRYLTIGVFEHLKITSTLDVEKMLAYAAHPQRSCAYKISRDSCDMQAVGEGARGR